MIPNKVKKLIQQLMPENAKCVIRVLTRVLYEVGKGILEDQGFLKRKSWYQKQDTFP